MEVFFCLSIILALRENAMIRQPMTLFKNGYKQNVFYMLRMNAIRVLCVLVEWPYVEWLLKQKDACVFARPSVVCRPSVRPSVD